jgi:signal transduction histidine kinase
VKSEKNSYLSLRSEDGFTFLVPLVHSVEFSMKAEKKMQETYAKYLGEVAKSLAQEWKDSVGYATVLVEKYKIFKVVRLDNKGDFVFATRGTWGNLKNKSLLKVCKGESDYCSLGLKENKYGTSYRFLFAKHIKDGAIVLIQEGDSLSSDFKELSYKHVFDSVSKYSDILFVVFQTFEGIDYISDKNLLKRGFLTKIEDDEELTEAIYSDNPFTRVTAYDNSEILECVYPVFIDGKFRGLVRAGLSLDFVNVLRKTFVKNMLASVLLVFVLDIMFLYSMFVTERRSKEGITFRSVLDSLNDGVVIFENNTVILKNNKAIQLLNNNPSVLLEKCTYPFEKLEIEGKKLLVLKNKIDKTSIYIIRDMSIEDIAEKSKERERQMLSMGRLSSVFAHEIRNPLNSISMIVQQLDMNECLSAKDKDMLNIVDKELNRLNRIVSEFMEVAKMPEIVKKRCEIAKIFEETELLYSAKSEKNNFNLKFKIEDNIKDIFVDVEKFKGVLINLIENAIGANSTEIEVLAKRNDNFIEITVKDNGIGMDKQTIKKAFELYYTTKEQGSGLGLPYVQRIITSHGGLVDIQSEKDKGTTIRILLKEGLEET